MLIKFHNDIYLPSAFSVDGPEGRVYQTPHGAKYFSITTALGEYGDQKFLEDWKKRVGEKEATSITKNALSRGTGMHNMIEAFLKGERINKATAGYLNFNGIRKHLTNISEIYFQEVALYSDVLELAGRTDLLGVYKNVESVVDFKTSRKQKKESWISKYFIQGAFYAQAFKERTNGRFDIKQIVILVSNDDGTSDEFISNVDDWSDELITVVDYFKEYRRKIQ